MNNEVDHNIAIIGLGYVGLPLAVEFGKQYPTVSFDINEARLAELQQGHDITLEVDDAELAVATQLSYTSKLDDLRHCLKRVKQWGGCSSKEIL